MSNMERPRLIMETIERNPGIRFSDMMKILKIKNGALKHHLDKLETRSVIKVERSPRVARFYSLDITESEIQIAKNLRQETPRRIIQLLLESEPINFTEIFKKIKKAPATTSFYTTQLVEDGVLIDTFENGKRFFSIIDRKTVISLISKYHPDLIERATDNFADIIASL